MFSSSMEIAPELNRSLIMKADDFDKLPAKFLAERMRVGDVLWYSQRHDAFVFTPMHARDVGYSAYDVLDAALDYATNPLIKENNDGDREDEGVHP